MATFVKDEHGNGKWMCRWTVTDENGTHDKKKRGFLTKKEAQAWFYENQPQTVKEEKPEMLFSDLCHEWLEYEKDRVKASSYYTLLSRVNNHILPFFEGKAVAEITPKDILAWQKSMEGYSFKYRNTIRARIVSIYKYAEKYHDIPNVMNKVDGLRNLEPKKEMQVWTPEEFSQFIACVSNETYKLFFETLYILGCRKGELMALGWCDIQGDTIHIHENVTNKGGSAWTVTTPKTASSDRRIRIPLKLSQRLDEYHKTHMGRFVFGDSRPLPTQTITYYFDNAVKESGVKRIRIHDLRHSCASLLISQGVDIVAVSKRLGHSSVTQTLDTYSHLMPSAEDMTVSILGSVMDKLGG